MNTAESAERKDRSTINKRHSPLSGMDNERHASLRGMDNEPKCPLCKDAHWLYATNDKGLVIWEGHKPKLIRCACQKNHDSQRHQQALQMADGLNQSERLLRFSDLTGRYNASALSTLQDALQRGHGLLTLVGKPGTGKTSMLICTVNSAREAGIPAIYTTVTDLLAYLRQAYDPKSEVGFDARWDALVKAHMLTLDELDEFNTTPWALERFLRLIDERWRNMNHSLTLCATNGRINALPDKVASRLRDGRAQILELSGQDMRPYQR